MKPKPHQIKFAGLIETKLRKVGYVYLSGKPRSGKTYTAILCCENLTKIQNVLVLTKKNAVDGWLKFIDGNSLLTKKYTVTNYEQVSKLKPSDYDIVIIDESHNIGAFPKPSGRYKTIKKLCYNMAHIHLSGTAIIESPCSIYHQMTISKYKPFKHKNFYDFHRQYGKPYYIKAAGRNINQYDRYKQELLVEIDKFTVYMTQEDAGISADLQAQDVIHYISLDKQTRGWYNELQEHGILEVNGYEIVTDSDMKLRVSLHMLEGGVGKIKDTYIELGNLEKVNYVKKTFGDSSDIGIMCHFVGERNLLSKHFKHAKLYSSSSHAEGVDLSHLRYFIIFSNDYSGAKFVQRRERIVNMSGSNTLEVHHLLVKGAISEQVYKRTSKKEDFNNSTYERNRL